MKRRLLQFYVFLLCVCFAPNLNAQPAKDVPSIAGEYTIQGRTDQGSYGGTATIYQKDRAVFVQWRSEQGAMLQGFGLIRGDVVAVAYASEHIGVAVLYVIKGAELIGEWPAVDGTLWPETLSKGKPSQQASR